MRSGVADASPLIVLARAGFIDLLPLLLSRIAIPRAVAAEIDTGPDDDAARRLLSSAPAWLSVVEVDPELSPLASWRLGRGEAEALEYARQNPGTVVLLDDKAARRAAQALELPMTGTLGVLLAAARSGLLPSFAEALETARECGLYFDPGVARTLLER